MEMKLDWDEDQEVMDDGLRTDIVKTILHKVSDMCVGAFSLPCLLMIYAYGKSLIDSSSFP